MTDLVKLFFDVELMRAKLAKTQERVKKQEEELRGAINNMLAPIRPICLEAIAQYNKNGGHIVPESIKIRINVEKSTLSMYARIRYASGNEPDEELDFRDSKKMAERFALILDPLLKQNALALKFDTFSFPTDYYMK